MTAFALLDLAGRAWIEGLAERVAAAGAGLYAPLCYDGALGMGAGAAGGRGGAGGVQRAPAARQGPRAGAGARRRRRRWRGRWRRGAMRCGWRRARGGSGPARRRCTRRWSPGSRRRRERRAWRRRRPGVRRGVAASGLALHGRPSRRAGLAGGGERAVEDHVGVEAVDVGLRPERVGEAGDRRGAQARGAGADDERRDGDVQPLQQAGVEEAGDGHAAALDEDAREAALGEGGADGGGGDPAVGGGELDHLDARRGAGAAQDWTTRRRTPSGRSTRASSGRRPRGSITTRAGLGPSTRRTVRRGSSPSAVRTPTTTASASARQRWRWRRPSGPETAVASPRERGDAAVERLADLREEVGRAAAVGGERRVERPGGARLGRPVRRAGRSACPPGGREAPTRPRR